MGTREGFVLLCNQPCNFLHQVNWPVNSFTYMTGLPRPSLPQYRCLRMVISLPRPSLPQCHGDFHDPPPSFALFFLAAAMAASAAIPPPANGDFGGFSPETSSSLLSGFRANASAAARAIPPTGPEPSANGDLPEPSANGNLPEPFIAWLFSFGFFVPRQKSSPRNGLFVRRWILQQKTPTDHVGRLASHCGDFAE